MARKTINVPIVWKTTVKNENGEYIDVSPNKEYKITNDLNDVIYVTISSVYTEDNGKQYIKPCYEIVPASFYPIVPYTGEPIDMSTIASIEQIHAAFVQDDRQFKDMEINDDDDTFTFSFDRIKDDRKYRITVLKGEFIGLAIRSKSRDGSTTKRTLYGVIEDADNESITFTRYLTIDGSREVSENCKLSVSNLLGIFRYRLEIFPYDESRKNRKRYRSDEKSEN